MTGRYHVWLNSFETHVYDTKVGHCDVISLACISLTTVAVNIYSVINIQMCRIEILKDYRSTGSWGLFLILLT